MGITWEFFRVTASLAQELSIQTDVCEALLWIMLKAHMHSKWTHFTDKLHKEEGDY